jgi:heme-degrading monooxygenase HmoA
MFLRFTYLYFSPEKASEAKSVYITEVAPEIRKQKGNKQVLLLEPAEGSDEFISFSLWETEADIKAFEASAAYPAVIGKIKGLSSKSPVQKYYLVND